MPIEGEMSGWRCFREAPRDDSRDGRDVMERSWLVKGDSSARVSLEVEYRHSDSDPATAAPEGTPSGKCAWSCEILQANGIEG
jgi:hypothetical protein